MGFWHTGYFEFHEPAYQPRVINYTPPPLPCPDCTQLFKTSRELDKHRFSGHPTAQPVLLLSDRECGSTRLHVHHNTRADDWAVLNCETVAIDNSPVELENIGITLADVSRGIRCIEMTNGRSLRIVEIEFDIADAPDLAGVDDCLDALDDTGELTLSSISSFIDDAAGFSTARRYRDGIATYLYGVLARERSPESGLIHSQYVDKYGLAFGMLSGFHRPNAGAICSLISFHFNHFNEASKKYPESQVESVSRRLELLLAGDVTPLSQHVTPVPTVVERKLVDSVTARVIELCSIPLDGSAGARVNDLECELDAHEPYDQLKLRIIAAEHHSSNGDEDLARMHELDVGYNIGDSGWIQRRINQREGRARR